MKYISAGHLDTFILIHHLNTNPPHLKAYLSSQQHDVFEIELLHPLVDVIAPLHGQCILNHHFASIMNYGLQTWWDL